MGVHYPGAAGNRAATFTLKNGLTVYGGFAGTESSRDERDWQANKTILSGDIDQNDNHGGDYINENASQIVGSNAYHVVTGGGTNNTAVLDGFIITAGQANSDSTGFPNDSGGGMYNEDSSPTLTNVTFSGNSASIFGGGMLNLSSSNLTLTNVIMWGDSAPNGPEIYNYGSSNPSISYSDIQGCGGSGGGWNSACGSDGGGNIDADPLFVDAAGGNLRLDFGSPAIDTGTNSGCPATDLDGLPRPADGNGDGTAACDMGAYEAGQMFCNVAANTAYTFDKNSNVVITTTAMLGDLSCLYVDEMELNHPNATTGIQSGRYWLIRGLQSDKLTDASGFSVTLTLPTTFTPDTNDKVCRYTGSGQVWDCAMNSFTASTITRNGVTAFSDWAVGNNVGPTAVRLTSFQASSAPSPFAWLFSAALAIAVFFPKKRLAKP